MTGITQEGVVSHSGTRRVRQWYRVVLVRRPKDWQPEGPCDEPPLLEVRKVVRSGLKRLQAECLLFSLNASSLAKGGRSWAVLRPEPR